MMTAAINQPETGKKWEEDGRKMADVHQSVHFNGTAVHQIRWDFYIVIYDRPQSRVEVSFVLCTVIWNTLKRKA